MCAGPSLYCSPQAPLCPHQALPAQAYLGLGDTGLESQCPMESVPRPDFSRSCSQTIHCNLPSWVTRVGSLRDWPGNTAKL